MNWELIDHITATPQMPSTWGCDCSVGCGSGRGHRGRSNVTLSGSMHSPCCPHGTALRGLDAEGPWRVVSRGRARPHCVEEFP